MFIYFWSINVENYIYSFLDVDLLCIPGINYLIKTCTIGFI